MRYAGIAFMAHLIIFFPIFTIQFRPKLLLRVECILIFICSALRGHRLGHRSGQLVGLINGKGTRVPQRACLGQLPLIVLTFPRSIFFTTPLLLFLYLLLCFFLLLHSCCFHARGVLCEIKNSCIGSRPLQAMPNGLFYSCLCVLPTTALSSVYRK